MISRALRKRREEGQYLLWFAILLPLIFLGIGLVFDGGRLFQGYRRAQLTADLAAQSGSQCIDVPYFQSENEVRLDRAKAIATAYVFKIECLEDAIRFVKLGRHPDYASRVRIAVIGKQTLKDGSGWEPAVVRTRQRVADIPGAAAGTDQYPEGHRPAGTEPGTPAGTRVATQYRCPDCGRLQVYRKGEQKGQVITDDEDYFASKLRRCLYDIVQEEEHTEYKGCGSFLGQVSRRIGGSSGHRQEGGLGRVAPPAVTYRRDERGHRVP